MFTSKLAAALIALGTSFGASQASASICSNFLKPEQAALGATARTGETWAAPSTVQVHVLRFRVRPNCAIEVFVQGWGWQELSESADVPGSYEATFTRASWSGPSEVLDLRFRFAGDARRTWIEAESWYFSSRTREVNGPPVHVVDTLFH